MAKNRLSGLFDRLSVLGATYTCDLADVVSLPDSELKAFYSTFKKLELLRWDRAIEAMGIAKTSSMKSAVGGSNGHGEGGAGSIVLAGVMASEELNEPPVDEAATATYTASVPVNRHGHGASFEWMGRAPGHDKTRGENWESNPFISPVSKTCSLPRHANATPASAAFGILNITACDSWAGWSTVFILYPINHILLAQKYCLIPKVHFNPQANYPNANAAWHSFFEPLNDALPASLPVHTLVGHGSESGAEFGVNWLHRNAPFGVHGYYWSSRDGMEDQYDCYNATWFAKQRTVAAGVVKDYLKVKPSIRVPLDDAWKEMGERVIGLHLRGTDKGGVGRQIVPPSAYLPYVRAYCGKYPNCEIFIATDDQRFIADIRASWPADLVGRISTQASLLAKASDRRLAKAEAPGARRLLPASPAAGYEKIENHDLHARDSSNGVACLKDIILLAKCDFMIYSASSVPESAIYFSPNSHLHSHGINLEYANLPKLGIDWVDGVTPDPEWRRSHTLRRAQECEAALGVEKSLV